jgi:hypothetical protein
MEVRAQLIAALTQEKIPRGWVNHGDEPGGFAERKVFHLAGIEHRTVQHAVTLDNDHSIPGALIFK